MKTLLLDVSTSRVVLTKLLARLSRRAYWGALSPLKLAELPDPPLPAPTWVRVRNQLCGICGSDLHQLFLDVSLSVAPTALPSYRRIYLGHEMVGQVVEKGQGVTGLETGDRVVRWGRADDCLARGRQELCEPCARGHRVLCQHAAEQREHTPIGGGFGDSFIVPATTLVQVPADLSDEQAIMVEPVAVAIHAAFRRRPAAGEKVLVLGCGTIGFLLIQVLRLLEPECQIAAIAQFPWQGAMARAYGADEALLVHEDLYEQIADLTGGKLYRGRGRNRMLLGGFDTVFDVVGIDDTLNNALRWTRAGGTVVLVGVNLHPIKLDLTPVWYQEVDLLGAVGHDVVTWSGEELSNFELAMRWMSKDLIRVDQMVTHRFRLDQYREAFATAIDKRTSRSIKVAFELK